MLKDAVVDEVDLSVTKNSNNEKNCGDGKSNVKNAAVDVTLKRKNDDNDEANLEDSRIVHGKKIKVWYDNKKNTGGYYVQGEVLSHLSGNVYKVGWKGRSYQEEVELKPENCTNSKENHDRWQFL